MKNLLVLNNLYELGATYLKVFLLWMLCSEPVLSIACVYFVVSADFMPFLGFLVLRTNLASIEKVRLEKSSSIYLGLVSLASGYVRDRFGLC